MRTNSVFRWGKCGLWVAFGCLAWGKAQAQTTHTTYPWTAYLGGQVNVLSAKHHALLLRARAQRNLDTDYNALAGDQLQRWQVQAGYEWLLSQRWSGGVAEKMTFDPGDYRTFHSAGFLRHCGHIGSVQFRKRALFEYLAHNQDQPSSGQIRLRADLDRTFPVGKVALRPRLAYEIQFDLSFEQKTKAEQQQERRVDHAYLRVELGVEVSERLTLVPYLLKQTDFIVAIEQTNADGHVVPGGPRNLRFPGFGFDVRYTLPGQTPGEKPRDLPTYEGFQD